jgi:AraC-like DNA-binding protein
MRLAAQFLDKFCSRDFNCLPEFINSKDFQAMVKVEHQLLNNYAANFPSIETLAKAVFMSESKLKKLFKQSYGMAVYQYYQKNRMHKAKELLAAGKLSVSETGAALGYQNLSNFSAAFKKEFGFLPSEFKDVL